MTTKRPLFIYIPVIIFIFSAIVSIAGVVGMLQSWNWLRVYSSDATPLYAVFKGVFLSLTYLVAVVLLWMRLNWSITYSVIISLVTAVWFWIDRVGLPQNSLPFSSHVLPLIITLALLISTLLSLYFVDPYMHQVQMQNQEPYDQAINDERNNVKTSN
jgi:hypothetical protein